MYIPFNVGCFNIASDTLYNSLNAHNFSTFSIGFAVRRNVSNIFLRLFEKKEEEKKEEEKNRLLMVTDPFIRAPNFIF